MTKKFRAGIIAVLSTLALSVVAIGAAANTEVVASANGATSGLGFEGVSIRVPDADASTHGIRFTATITEAQYNANAQAAGGAEKVFYGMEIKAADQAVAQEVSVDSLRVTVKDGVGTFIGSLVNLEDGNLTRPYQARAYYSVNGGEKVYGAWSEARAIFSIATQAIVDSDWGNETAKTALNTDIVEKVMDTTKNGHYALDDTFTVTAGDKSLNELANGDIVTVKATASNGVNTLDVYPAISITSSTGATMGTLNVLEQVASEEDQYKVDFAYPAQFKIAATLGESTKEASAAQVAGNSYKATVEGDAITLQTGMYYKQGESGNPNANGNGTDLGFYGLGEVASDKKLVFTFTGKNIPNVTLCADSDNGQAIGGGEGIYIQTSSRDSAWNGRTAVLGVNSKRYESGVASDYTNYQVEDVGGKNGRFAEDTSDTAISMGKLADGVRYEYTVAPTISENTLTKVDLTLKSWNEADQAYTTTVHSKTFTINADVGANRKAIAYGATSYASNPTSITFAYEKKDLIDWTMISTAEQLTTMLTTATSGYYKLANDIDLNGATVSGTTSFAGVLDGAGFMLSNLATKGLFQGLSGTVKNLVISDATISESGGILSYNILAGATVSNVVIRTKADATMPAHAGLLGRQLAAGKAGLTLEDVILVVPYNSRGKDDTKAGFIASFATAASTVNATNCYFVGCSGVYSYGIRGDNNASYITALNSETFFTEGSVVVDCTTYGRTYENSLNLFTGTYLNSTPTELKALYERLDEVKEA